MSNVRSSIYYLGVVVALPTTRSGRMRAAVEKTARIGHVPGRALRGNGIGGAVSKGEAWLAGLSSFIEGSFQVLEEFLAASIMEVESGVLEAQILRAVRA